MGSVVSRAYRSIFGEVTIDRYVYGSCEEGQVPLDATLNLPEWKYSYLLQEWGLAFTCKEAFAEAGQTLEQILGLGLAVGTLERVSKKWLEGALSEATAPAQGVGRSGVSGGYRRLQRDPPGAREGNAIQAGDATKKKRTENEKEDGLCRGRL